MQGQRPRSALELHLRQRAFQQRAHGVELVHHAEQHDRGGGFGEEDDRLVVHSSLELKGGGYVQACKTGALRGKNPVDPKVTRTQPPLNRTTVKRRRRQEVSAIVIPHRLADLTADLAAAQRD